jgi:hypothetical protein
VTGSGAFGAPIATGLVSVSYTDPAITQGTSYDYAVVAIRGGLPSPDSNIVSIGIPIAGVAGATADSVSKSRCGLTGIEWLAGLATLALWRRRRRR